MSSVDYKFWAKYIIEIHKAFGSSSDVALEIGSGNGKLSKYLKGEFREIYLSDYSFQMLKQNNSIHPLVCCDMLNLPFKKKFDFIFSTFDTINYLYKDEQLKVFFQNIVNIMTPDTIFCFDVSLKNNSIKHLKRLNRNGKYKGIEYLQKSEFDLRTLIHKNKIIIKPPDGNVYCEEHIQKIYDFYYYFQVLENSELYIIECFEAFDFKDAEPSSDRVQFIVKRKI